MGGLSTIINCFNLLGTCYNMALEELLDFFVPRTMFIDGQILVKTFHPFSLAPHERKKLLDLNIEGLIITHIDTRRNGGRTDTFNQ